MKKKLTLLLALLLVVSLVGTVLVACNKGLSDDQLKVLLSEVRKTHQDDSTVTNANFGVVGKVSANVDGKNLEANVKWESSSSQVTIGTELNANGFYQVSVPDPYELEEDLSYTLTATLVNGKGEAYKDSEGSTYSISFNRKVESLGTRPDAVLTFASATATGEGDYTDSFGNKGYEKVIWVENGITLEAIRGESSTGSAINTPSARFYAKSTIEVSYTSAFKSLRFTLDDYQDGKYLPGFDGMKVEGATIARQDSTVIVVFDEPVTKFVSGQLSVQTRMTKVELFINEALELPPEEEAPAHVTDKTVNELATNAPADMAYIYEVTGIWVPTGAADDTYGNGKLVDPETGKSLTIYGMAPSEDAFSFISGKYSFNNPKQFQTIKDQFAAGDQIKLGVTYSTNYKNYYSFFMGKVSDAANFKYTANVSFDSDKGSVTLSKDNDLVYGDEVTINIQPQTGFKVDSVTHNGTAVRPVDGVYKFNVTVGVNLIEVTFMDADTVVELFEITPENLLDYSGTTVGYNSEEVTKQLVISGSDTVTVTYMQYSCYGEGLQTRNSSSNVSYLFSTTAFAYPIDSIELVPHADKTSNGAISISFGAAAITEKPTSFAGTYKLSEGTKTIVNTVSGATFFRIDHTTSGAMYLDKIIIHFNVSGHDHVYGDWESNNDGTHTGTCNQCDKTFTESCVRGAEDKCDKCGYEFEPLPSTPDHVTDKTVNELATTAPADSMKVIYEVEGIWVPTGTASDTYGNGNLYDPETGKYIVIYGMAPTEEAFSYDAATGVYSFTNPKKFQDLASSFTAGDKIKVGIAYNASYKNYYSYFISREELAENIKYDVQVVIEEDTRGTATASVAQATYNQEVTVTISVNDGSKLVSIKLGDKDLTKVDETNYKFNAVVGKNVVTVVFAESGAATKQTKIIDFTVKNGPMWEAAGSTSDASNVKQVVLESIQYNFLNCKKGSSATNEYAYLMIVGGGYLETAESFPGNIVSVTVTVPSGAAAAATYVLTLLKADGSTVATQSQTGNNLTVSATAEQTDECVQFKLAQTTSGKNGQVTKIEIEYYA